MMTHPPFPSASLYVGDLASDVSEGHLFDIFNQVGPVSLIRVCRDVVTRRRSLGYAYVNYHNIVDAEKALELLNNTPIRGKNCRIMWCQRDPSLRKSGVGNIFVKNLDKSIGHKELLEMFSGFGNILSYKVATDPLTNQSRGFGFVHFENPEDAKKAEREFNGKKIGDKELFVGPFHPKKERTPVEDKFTNLFVKNLEEDVDENKLREMFEVFGKVTSTFVSYEEQSSLPQQQPKEGEEQLTPNTQTKRKSKCFGFVNFENHSQALAAIEGLHLKTFKEGGKQLFVGRAQKKSERLAELKQKFTRQKKFEHPGFNLYVRNLDEDMTDQKLKSEFQPFGQVLNAKVMRDEKGASRSFGFVSFLHKEDLQKVLQDFKQTNKAGQLIHVAPAYKRNKRPHQTRGLPAGSGAPVVNNHKNTTNSSRGGMVRSQSSKRYNSGGRGGNSSSYNNKNNNNKNNTQQRKNNNNNRPYAGKQKNYSSRDNSKDAPKKEKPGNVINTTGKAPQQQQQRQQQQTTGNKENTSTTAAQTPIQVPTPTPTQAPETTTTTTTPETSAPASAPQTTPTSESIDISTLSLEDIQEKLYELICKHQPDFADKITGMLIDSFPDAKDLALFLTDEAALQNKINEALTLC